MKLILDSLAAIGRGVIGACRVTGSLAIFAAIGVSHLFRPPFYGRLFARAMLEIGYFSLPVVALTAIFTGMVLALQSYTGFARFSAESAIANVVVLSITRELGPVLAGLMVSGRIGAAMAARLSRIRFTRTCRSGGTGRLAMSKPRSRWSLPPRQGRPGSAPIR